MSVESFINTFPLHIGVLTILQCAYSAHIINHLINLSAIENADIKKLTFNRQYNSDFRLVGIRKAPVTFFL
jgi:hypothetical protein